MRIVLDSNVLLAAIGKKSRYRAIWDSFLSGNYKLIVSEYVLYKCEEYSSGTRLKELQR